MIPSMNVKLRNNRIEKKIRSAVNVGFYDCVITSSARKLKIN